MSLPQVVSETRRLTQQGFRKKYSMPLFNSGKTTEENAVDFVIECDEAGIESLPDDEISHQQFIRDEAIRDALDATTITTYGSGYRARVIIS